MESAFNTNILSKLTENSQTSTFTLAIGSVIVVLFMIVVAIRPAVVSVVKQISSNRFRNELIASQVSKIETLRSMVTKQTEFSTEIELFRQSFPSFDDIEFLVQNLAEYDDKEALFSINSISVNFDPNDNQFSDSQSEQNIQSMNITLSFQSTGAEIVDFVEYIESFPRIMNIESLRVASNQSIEDFSLPMLGTIQLKSYYVVEENL